MNCGLTISSDIEPNQSPILFLPGRGPHFWCKKNSVVAVE